MSKPLALSLKTLEDLDCGAAQAWEAALQRAIADCRNRPTEDKPRKVILQAELVPTVDGDDVELLFQVTDKIPSFVTQSVWCQVRRRAGRLMFVFSSEPESEDAT